MEPERNISAALSDPIQIEDGLLRARFYWGDSVLTRGDLKEILATEQSCEPRLKTGKLYENSALALGGLSGAVFLYGAASSLAEGETRPLPIVAGASTFLLNYLCFNHFDLKNLRVAVDIFNRRFGGASAGSGHDLGFALVKPLPGW